MEEYNAIQEALKAPVPPGEPPRPDTVRARCSLCHAEVNVTKDCLKERPVEALANVVGFVGTVELGVECPACHRFQHGSFVCPRLIMLRNGLKAFTHPTEYANRLRFVERKFARFQMDVIWALAQANSAGKPSEAEQAAVYQKGIEHLEAEA